jgi:hypothetical protein
MDASAKSLAIFRMVSPQLADALRDYEMLTEDELANWLDEVMG